MTQKARPFPADQAFTATTRQYLNRLSNVEANNDTQFAAITSRMGQVELTTTGLTQDVSTLETQVTALQGDIIGALAAIEPLQQESAAHAEAIDLLNSRYDTAHADLDGVRADLDGALAAIEPLQQESAAHAEAIDLLNSRYDTAHADLDGVRADLDGALAAIQGLAGDLDHVAAAVESHTQALAETVADVRVLQHQDEGIQATLEAIGVRVTTAEGDLDTAQTDIQALHYTDLSIASQLRDNQARLDYLIESQGTVGAVAFSERLPLSDSVLGTVPKVVGVLILPTGDYAAPIAYLGCPTTPAFTATLRLVEEADSAVLATVAGTGTMAWQTASAGFTLTTETSIELRLVGSDATAVAIIKGLRLTHAT